MKLVNLEEMAESILFPQQKHCPRCKQVMTLRDGAYIHNHNDSFLCTDQECQCQEHKKAGTK